MLTCLAKLVASTTEIGKQGEAYALRYLRRKGYTIVDINWYYQKKELDIIARYDNKLVIVEVKTRKEGGMEPPKEAVTAKKQRLIIKAADAYVMEHEIDEEVRFDIIEVIISGKLHEIEHIEDAFYPRV